MITSRNITKSKISTVSENIVSYPLRTCALRRYGISIYKKFKKIKSKHKRNGSPCNNKESRFVILFFFKNKVAVFKL